MIAADLRLVLVRELSAFQREIELFPDDELLFKTVPGIANSAGNLALHVCGNLRHFIGNVLGKVSYTRNRELEFSQRSETREDLIRELQTTIEVIESVLPTLGEDTLSADYPEALAGMRVRTGLFLLHLSIHLAHHLGQAGYLRRILTGQNQPSGAVSVQAFANP